MNERIKQLAEQADEYADTKLQMPGEYHPDWHDVRDEKFAELIVKECVHWIDGSPSLEDGTLTTSRDILELSDETVRYIVVLR
jgi:hypothetical protein